jgi:putative Mg2+ transporter-C (MgtC) family protein
MVNPWLHWWTDGASFVQQPTFPRLLLALVLGSLIGAERQWRQRAAGMRTNTLVCFGAAAFVDLGATIGGPSTTSIIAYTISGVGFLGAGAIMKEGGSIRGLNTAATLWCSAAVGACAGAGELLDAVFVTVLLVGINLVLRPASRYIDRKSLARSIKETDAPAIYRLSAVCPASDETSVRALLLRAVAERPLLCANFAPKILVKAKTSFSAPRWNRTPATTLSSSRWPANSEATIPFQRSSGPKRRSNPSNVHPLPASLHP